MTNAEKIKKLKIQIRRNYAQLNKQFRVFNRPTTQMRELQNETWNMKAELRQLQESNKKDSGQDLPLCPHCGAVMEQVWDNVGYQPPDPPHHVCIGLRCPECGHEEE